MSRNGEAGTHPFSWRKARRTAAVHGFFAGAAAAATKVAIAWVMVEPISGTVVLTVTGITAVAIGSASLGGEAVNHKLDDPIFDARTTILFDLVGLTFGYLLFVVPAMQLEAALRSGHETPGAFALLALCLTSFGVVILRGLLMNFGVVRDGTYYERDRMTR